MAMNRLSSLTHFCSGFNSLAETPLNDSPSLAKNKMLIGIPLISLKDITKKLTNFLFYDTNEGHKNLKLKI